MTSQTMTPDLTDPADETIQSADMEWIESPVDDETYDLMMALASKLEAIDTYQIYAEDGNADLWRELAGEERRHAERLFSELKQRLAGS